MQGSAMRTATRSTGLSRPTSRPVRLAPRAAVAMAEAPKIEKKEEKKEDKKEEKKFNPRVSSKEVAQFLTTLVEETDIVEMHLEVGSFELKVRRSTSAASAAAPVASPAAVAAPAPIAPPPAPPAPSAAPLESVDESVVQVTSNKVGIFRRGKYAAGKRVGNGNAVNEGDQVKKGAPLGFIEQLGTYFPLEAPQAGEVLKFRISDGEPVDYMQLVVDLAPFFGGHIIGDKKHA